VALLQKHSHHALVFPTLRPMKTKSVQVRRKTEMEGLCEKNTAENAELNEIN
jgi:hypothetical protein